MPLGFGLLSGSAGARACVRGAPGPWRSGALLAPAALGPGLQRLTQFSPFLQPNKVVVVLNGRYAGHKAVVVKNFDEGTSSRPYGHALVCGIANYPRKARPCCATPTLAAASDARPRPGPSRRARLIWAQAASMPPFRAVWGVTLRRPLLSSLQITKQMTKQKQDKKSKIKARAPQRAGCSAAGPRALRRQLARSASPRLWRDRQAQR